MPPSGTSVRVCLADDHPIFLEGVRTLLRETPDISVVADAQCGAGALQMIEEARPDIVILDVEMPDMHGIAVAQHLAAERSLTRVILLTAHEERGYLRQALCAGVKGYVLKRSVGQNLLLAIRAVREGGLYVDPSIAVRFFQAGNDAEQTATHLRMGNSRLSDREENVLRLIAFGLTHKEIAGKLDVNEKSVESYKTRAMDKIGIRTRAKIVRYGVLQGWFHDAKHFETDR
ncbi:MAG TPA: response regulator transcription factor [Methylobacterium sp.]|jgi:DNA-binding NarL/FixJ family response regulator